MQKQFTAFTLAETLITLGIIGIVAAMTIPTIMVNYQKQVTVTQLQKNYSALTEAVKLSIIDNGEISNWVFPVTISNADMTNFLNTYIYPYLQNIKNCPLLKNCSTVDRYNLKYEVIFDNTSVNPAVLLNDGTLLWGVAGLPNNRLWTWIYIDINGDKYPNILGKDVFILDFSPNNIKMLWQYDTPPTHDGLLAPGNSGQCNVNAAGSGAGNTCGALIQVDGWQISSDYPW